MVWISTILLSLFSLNLGAKALPKFLTKYNIQTLKFITSNGQYAYTQKRPGVLGLVSSFRSVDFISESSTSDFIMRDSRFKKRLAIEIIPNAHSEYNLLKNHRIVVVDWGKTQVKEVGFGKGARLHLQDEWISYYDSYQRTIYIQNIITQKKYKITRSPKASAYFLPEVEMISSDTVVYTDIDYKGVVGLIKYNLITESSTLVYKNSTLGTRLELCQSQDYLGIGEFPYDDISRPSKILQIKLNASSQIGGYTTLYSSADADLGNMVCTPDSIYFVKTIRHLPKINFKQTEAVKLVLKNNVVESSSDLGSVSQLISMDGKVLIPFRGEHFVLEGSSDLSQDSLKSTPLSSEEELPLEL
jgi:hypothetical protein